MNITEILSIRFIIKVREGIIMTICPYCTGILKYRLVQRLFEYYYQRKMNCNCFIMHQNNRWTVVTFNL